MSGSGQGAVLRLTGWVQGQNLYSGQTYLPYSIGLLAASVRAHVSQPDAVSFLTPVWKREPPELAALRLKGAHVVFFSVYVWNERWSLAVAQEIKKQNPLVLTVFGGPQVPDQAEAYLRQHPQVDLTCQGEGEWVAVALMERLLDPASDLHPTDLCTAELLREVPSIRFLDPSGVFHAHPVRARERSLDHLPSPYLTGIFDDLLTEWPGERWLMLLETNRGCPYACTFCDWGSATATRLNSFPLDRIQAELDWAGAHGIDYVFVCDANFGILPRDQEIVAAAARSRKAFGNPQTLSVQTAKVGAERIFAIWKAIIDAGLNREAAMPVQSTDAQTLKEIKRLNLSLPDFERLSQRFASHEIRTYSDIILGLPGESYDTFANSVDQLIQHGQHHRIQFSNLTVLPNAELASIEARDRYGLQTVFTRIATSWSMQADPDPLPELQELVVGTHAMPASDWMKARMLAWATVLFHCHKLLQVPLVLLHRLTGIGYRRPLEALLWDEGGEAHRSPVLTGIRRRFQQAAEDIQRGIPEYIADHSLPGVWLPPDDLSLTLLHVHGLLPAFFVEAEARLSLLIDREVEERSAPLAAQSQAQLIHEAIALSALMQGGRASGEASGSQRQDSLTLGFNVWELFLGVIEGHPVPLKEGRFVHRLTKSADFYRRVQVEDL